MTANFSVSLLWWLSVPATILLFLTLRKLNQSIKPTLLKTLTNPVLLSILILAGILLYWQLPYSQFIAHSQLLTALLEPAIVVLALPLYQQFVHVKKYFLLIFISCSLGVINATVVASILAMLFNVPPELSASIAALSVTTPISLIVTEAIGGISALAAVMVIFVGLFGAIFGFLVFRLTRIYNLQAQGIAMGSTCHAIGTAAALAEHPKAGAFSSVAMAITALLTALIVPWLYPLLTQFLL